MVLPQEDATTVFLPRFAVVDCLFGFLNLAADGAFAIDDGRPIPDHWLRAFAPSTLQVDEGALMAAVWEWCRQFERGEPLEIDEPEEPGADQGPLSTS